MEIDYCGAGWDSRAGCTLYNNSPIIHFLQDRYPSRHK